jgi:hypothetical protein
MRVVPLILAASALASCTVAPPPPGYGAAEAQREQAALQQELAGRVPAGPPQSCLPPGPTYDSRNVGENTIVFRRGSTMYVNHPPGGCSGLGNPFYALVTRSVGQGPCRGDTAEVVDLSNHVTVGVCSLGEFIPYRRPR